MSGTEDEWENDSSNLCSTSCSSSSSTPLTASSHESDATRSSLSGSESEQENVKDYKRGGYHPLKPKDILNDRYYIIRKLGWGHFSTVWMVFDRTEQDFKALKVVRSAKTYTETARDEIDLLNHAAKADQTDPAKDAVVRLHESFEIDGPFGHHVVLVMEITGPSLFTWFRRACPNGLPLLTIRNLSKRILEGLAYLHHKAQMIHTDLKPENIALAIDLREKLKMAKEAMSYTDMNLSMPNNYQSTYFVKNLDQPKCVHPVTSRSIPAFDHLLPESSVEASLRSCIPDPTTPCDPPIKIVDMGNACWTYKKFTNDIQTREYRAFEVIMGAEYQANVDIWSFGCVMFELATGDYLFNPKHGDDFATDEDHIAQMIERLGPPPRRLTCRGKYSHKFFNRRGIFKCFDPADLEHQTICELLMEEYHWKEKEALAFAQFIEACLVYDPAARPGAADLLKHPFFETELRSDYIEPGTSSSPAKDSGDTAENISMDKLSTKCQSVCKSETCRCSETPVCDMEICERTG